VLAVHGETVSVMRVPRTWTMQQLRAAKPTGEVTVVHRADIAFGGGKVIRSVRIGGRRWWMLKPESAANMIGRQA
jgi:hypothetical protein